MTAVQINNHPSNPLPPSRAKNRKSQNPHMEPGRPLEAVPVEGLGWGRGSRSWKGSRGSSSGGAGGDHLGTTLSGTNLSPSPQRSPRLPSLQAFRPHAPPPRPELSGRLQTRPPRDGVTAVSSWYLSGLGNLLHPVNPNIVLDFDQNTDQVCPPPFLTEPSRAPTARSGNRKTCHCTLQSLS